MQEKLENMNFNLVNNPFKISVDGVVGEFAYKSIGTLRQALKNLEKEVRDLQHEKHGRTGNKSQRLFKPSEELAYKIFYKQNLNDTITVRKSKIRS